MIIKLELSGLLETFNGRIFENLKNTDSVYCEVSTEDSKTETFRSVIAYFLRDTPIKSHSFSNLKEAVEFYRKTLNKYFHQCFHQGTQNKSNKKTRQSKSKNWLLLSLFILEQLRSQPFSLEKSIDYDSQGKVTGSQIIYRIEPFNILLVVLLSVFFIKHLLKV